MLDTIIEAAREGIFWGLTYFMLTYAASWLASYWRDWDNW